MFNNVRCWLRALVLAVGCWGLLVAPAAAQVALSGQVVDQQGKPLPARLYVVESNGKHHLVQTASAKGSAVTYNKVIRGGKSIEVHTTLSAHPFQAKLPAGTYKLTAVRGHEYHPTTVETSGDAVTLKLQRWVNMSDHGWFSGDTHVHRRVSECPNLVMAEDLNVALPLTSWVTRAYVAPTQGKLREKVSPKLIKVDDTHVIYPMNTEYEIFTVNGKRQTQGAVFVLNHKRPLTMGAPPVRPIADEARSQGALLDLDKHSWAWSMMIVPLMNVDLFELANNHVWRTNFGFPSWTIDTNAKYMKLETTKEGWTEWGWIDFGFKNYYALLNCGFRMRPTGGTASGVHPVPLGFGRVYVHLPNGFNYADWIKGLNAGRSFVSTGPMLRLKFNGQPHGRRFQFSTRRKPVCEIEGVAESRVPLDRIEIVANGEVVKTIKPENQVTAARGYASRISSRIEFPSSAWVCVRCFEKSPEGRIRFAHTSPAYYDVADAPVRPRKAEIAYFIELMRRQLERNKNVLRENELAEYQRALAIYRRIAKTARD